MGICTKGLTNKNNVHFKLVSFTAGKNHISISDLFYFCFLNTLLKEFSKAVPNFSKIPA